MTPRKKKTGAPPYQDLGKRVLDRRLELRLGTIHQASAAAGVSPTTWGLLENGWEVPKTQRVQGLICRALRWPPDFFDGLIAGAPVAPPSPAPIEVELAELKDALEQVIGRLDRLEPRSGPIERVPGDGRRFEDLRAAQLETNRLLDEKVSELTEAMKALAERVGPAGRTQSRKARRTAPDAPR